MDYEDVAYGWPYQVSRQGEAQWKIFDPSVVRELIDKTSFLVDPFDHTIIHLFVRVDYFTLLHEKRNYVSLCKF